MIIALITGIALAAGASIIFLIVCTTKYNSWGAAALMIFGPAGWLVNLIASFIRCYQRRSLIIERLDPDSKHVVLQFLGVVALDAFLMPLQQALELAERLRQTREE